MKVGNRLSVTKDKGKGAPLLFFLFYLFSITGCSLFQSQQPLARISPPPEVINSASGFFSFRLERESSLVRGRAFVLIAPGKGRIDILDPLGRLAFIALWFEKEEWLVVPAKKAYWSGNQGRGELMAHLINLPLDPIEILAWIIGRGQGLEPLAEGLNLSWAMEMAKSKNLSDQEKRDSTYNWQVEWNEAGQLKRGQRNDLKIQIQEYIKDKGVARVLTFSYLKVSGKLTVLGLDFNQPIPSHNFHPKFIFEEGYRALSWDEMKSLLKLD